MIYLRGCPSCGRGLVESGHGLFGYYAMCLECGFSLDLNDGRDPVDALREAWNELRPSEPFQSEEVSPFEVA